MSDRIVFRLPAEEKKLLENLTEINGNNNLSETIRELIRNGLKEEKTMERLEKLEEKFAHIDKNVSLNLATAIYHEKRTRFAFNALVDLLDDGDTDEHGHSIAKKIFLKNIKENMEKKG